MAVLRGGLNHCAFEKVARLSGLTEVGQVWCRQKAAGSQPRESGWLGPGLSNESAHDV